MEEVEEADLTRNAYLAYLPNDNVVLFGDEELVEDGRNIVDRSKIPKLSRRWHTFKRNRKKGEDFFL